MTTEKETPSPDRPGVPTDNNPTPSVGNHSTSHGGEGAPVRFDDFIAAAQRLHLNMSDGKPIGKYTQVVNVQCPACAIDNPGDTSLVVVNRSGRAGIECRNGCSINAIGTAIGLGGGTPAPREQPHSGQVRMAYRLAEQYADKLLHVAGLGWHYWDGKRWALDDRGEAQRAVLAVLKQSLLDSFDSGDQHLRKDVQKCESAAGIAGVLAIAGAL